MLYSSSNPVDLPHEIIELIIDNLASFPCPSSRTQTLRAFSLTSNAFVGRCQRHLFETIDLGDKHIPGRVYYNRFFDFITSLPCLSSSSAWGSSSFSSSCSSSYDDGGVDSAECGEDNGDESDYSIKRHHRFRSYIKHLRIVDTYAWDPSSSPSSPSEGGSNSRWDWLATEESLCDLLDILPSLESFELAFLVGNPKWSDFDPCIRHSLMQLARQPSLRSFSLGGINAFPPACLVTLTSCVRKLKLDNVDVDLGYLGGEAFGIVLELIEPPKGQCVVEEVVLRMPGRGLVHVLQSIFGLHGREDGSEEAGVRVKTLKIALREVKKLEGGVVETGAGENGAEGKETEKALVGEFWKLLQSVQGSLKELEWRAATRKGDVALRPPAPIDLSVLESLNSLHFLVNFHSSSSSTRGGGCGVFVQLLSILEDISSGSARLQELTIECMFMNVAELVASSSDWLALDAMLCREEFNEMRWVTFKGRMRGVPKKMRESARVILGEQLRGARGRGVQVGFDVDFLG